MLQVAVHSSSATDVMMCSESLAQQRNWSIDMLRSHLPSFTIYIHSTSVPIFLPIFLFYHSHSEQFATVNYLSARLGMWEEHPQETHAITGRVGQLHADCIRV